MTTAVAGVVIAALSLAATGAGMGYQYGYVVPESNKRLDKQKLENEIAAKGQETRELMQVNSQARLMSLRLGESSLDLINAKRENVVALRSKYSCGTPAIVLENKNSAKLANQTAHATT